MWQRQTGPLSVSLSINRTVCMKVKVRAEKVRFTLAVPTSMAAWAVKRIPTSAFTALQKKIQAPYDRLVTKENLRFLLQECSDVLRENRGLEVVHVDCSDGTFVSIVL